MFINIAGTAITDLTGNANYPDHPGIVRYEPYFELWAGGTIGTPPANDVMNNYGSRIKGYFYPPTTGNYTFYICSDDLSQLYLSTDEDPANKKLIAQETVWSNPREYFTSGGNSDLTAKDSSQFATTAWPGGNIIALTKGKAYYIEALHKEGGGGDNLSVSIDGVSPIPGSDLSPIDVPASPALTYQPQDVAAYVGSTVSFHVGFDIPPGGTLTSIKWTKNGTDIANSNSQDLSLTAATADNGSKYQAIVTTSAGTLTSSTATLNVASLSTEFTVGLVKFEAYTGISGTAVTDLTGNSKYIAGTPDDVRLLGGIDSPNGYGDNYGAKVSGFIVPPESGSFRFFLRSDDASELWLSTDDKEANATLIAQETSCCHAFTEPDSDLTSAPISLVAGKKYAFYALLKEGGGGDFVQVAVRKEGDTAAAGTLKPVAGNWIGVNARPSIGDVQINQQPQGLPRLIEGRTGRLSVAGVVTPTLYNFPLLIQWQKDGVNIAGATSPILIIANATSANSGVYHAVLNAPSGKSVTSADATVAVVPDTFPPEPTVAAVKNQAGTYDVGVQFDEPVDAAAATQSNYSISGGTVTGFTSYPKTPGVVLVVSGLDPTKSYTVTVKNVADAKGNKITSVTKDVSFSKMSWGVVGGDRMKLSNGVVAVGSNGFDIYSDGSTEWNNYDESTFVYEQITGDFDKKLRVEYQDNSSQWARAGLACRDVTNFGVDDVAQFGSQVEGNSGVAPFDGKAGRYQKVHVNPQFTVMGTAGNYSWEGNRRLVTGGPSSSAGGSGTPQYPNAWCRLSRKGDLFTIYRSDDGVNWTQLGTTTFPDPMPATLYVGPEYCPENGNITDETLRGVWLAQFREYSDVTSTTTPTGPDYAIGLNFGADEPNGTKTATLAPTDQAGVAAVAQVNWNDLSLANGTNNAIVASAKGTSTPTSVTVTWSSANTWASIAATGRASTDNIKLTGADRNLMAGYLDTGDPSTTSVSVRGLPQELTSSGYDVYVYTTGDNGGRGGGYRIINADTKSVIKDYVRALAPTNAASYIQIIPNSDPKVWAVGNYIVFSGLDAPNITIEATTASPYGAGTTKRAPINAVQLVAPASSAPPPHLTVAAGAAGLSITFSGSLQTADAVIGPWTDVTGTSPLAVSPSGKAKFYRAKK